jgi:hypothetical protein
VTIAVGLSWTSNSMLVQLLYFPGCPHVAAARTALWEVLRQTTERPELEEIDVTAPETPEHLRHWGSPTILVDGLDISGGSPSGVSCRLYPGPDGPGAPTKDLIVSAIRRAGRPVR